MKEKYDNLIADGLTPIRRWGTPEDVGKAVAAIAQDLLPFSTGEVINVDGGFHASRPGFNPSHAAFQHATTNQPPHHGQSRCSQDIETVV